MKPIKILAALVLVVLLTLSVARPPAAAEDVFQVVLRVLRLVQSEFWREVSPEVLIRGAINGIMEALDDPHSVYMEPRAQEQFMRQVTGAFAGIGVSLEITPDGARLSQVFRHSPAARAGLRAGDVILFVETQDVRHLTLAQLSALIRGEVGTMVSLSFYRSSVSTLRTVSIRRETVVAPSAQWRMLEGNIGYIDIDFFGAALGEDMREAMTDLRGARGLVLDLRGNPGGMIRSMMDTVPHFVPAGPLAIMVARGGQRETVMSPGPGPGVPLVVLVDERTASAAEILAAAIMDRQSGVLVGTQTYGKGVAQGIYDLGQTIGALRLTVVGYLTPTGREIEGRGLEPNVTVAQRAPEVMPPLAELVATQNGFTLGQRHPEIVKLHRALTVLGFYEGAVSDHFTAGTRQAIMRFQQHFNLYRDGLATPELLEQVNLRLVRPPVWRDAQLEAALENLRGRLR
ncbi:MAG: Carboxy-terminal processing protease CtpA [Firmicutes bacterium]|nr:Carboxy-terminal processing protease CtpA [Bacillota bacterium]